MQIIISHLQDEVALLHILKDKYNMPKGISPKQMNRIGPKEEETEKYKYTVYQNQKKYNRNNPEKLPHKP
jgi:hypothetical protein